MKITVVTVCYNAEKTIEKTMQSVLRQTYREIEYLIIDGESKDSTLGIIRKYESDKRVRLVSEPDNGLYNAMNKALNYSTGQYVIYMNSGDIFCDNEVIEDMAPYLTYDLVYGNAVRKTWNGNLLEKYSGKFKIMSLLLMGKMMSHQSLFTQTDIMKQYRFDERFKICADYNFITRAKRDGLSMKYVDRTVCIVDNVEGISSQIDNYNLMRQEDDISLKENFPFLYYLIKIPKGLIRVIKRIIEKRLVV